MYTLTVARDFVAQHFLIGGDWGPENEWHSHHYKIEIELQGAELDQHGYLVDIVDLEHHLDELKTYYKDHTLNELTEFEGLNPSIEHFSRIFAQQVNTRIDAPNITTLTVTVWEDDIARASYQLERG